MMPRAALSLFLLVSFGCTTVRAPVSSLDDLREEAEPARIEPQLELWLESGEHISEAEKIEALDAARAALEDAIDRQEILPTALGATDAVLVVRERGVSRTSELRHEQVAAVIAIVVGVVVVIAVLVAASGGGSQPGSISGSGGSSSGHGFLTSHAAPTRWLSRSPPVASAAPRSIAPAPAFHAAPVFRAPAAPAIAHPIAGPISPRPRPPIGPTHIAHGTAGSGFYYAPPQPLIYYDPFDTWLDLEIYQSFENDPVVVTEVTEAAGEGPPEEPPPPDSTMPPPDDEQAPPLSPDANGEQPRRPPPLDLPPPSPLPLEARGYFSGDQTLLEVDLLDRATGALLWNKSVAATVDPCDEDDVRRLLEQALRDQRWAHTAR